MIWEHPNISSTILIFSCIDRYLQTYLEHSTTILTVNTAYDPKTPVIHYNKEQDWKPYSLIKPGAYVIDSSSHDLEDILDSLEYRSFFNPAAMFILISDIVECRMASILRKYFIHTFVLIEKSWTDPKIYRCTEIGDDLAEPIAIDRCIMQKEASFEKYYKSDWNNSIFKVGIGHSPPFVIQDSPKAPYTGLDIDIVDFISTQMQFTPIYEPSPNFVGTKNNSSYNGALGLLSSKSADMVMGGMFAHTDSSLDFTVSYPIHRTSYSWFVPGPTTIPFWKRILLIYQPSVSLAIFLFYVLMMFLLFIFNGLILKSERKFYNECFKLYSSANSAPIRINQKEGCSKKMFYICWFMFWLILNASFTSKLLQCLIKKKYDFPINSLEDLNEVKMEVCILSGLESTLRDYKGKVISCTECGTCLDRTAFQKDLVTVRNTDLVDYYKSRYLDADGNPLIHALKEKYFAIFNVMIFRKNHPLFQRFNEIVRRMITSGVMAHFRQKYETSWEKNAEINDWRSLEFNPLKFIFNFWCCGLGLSVIVFIAEIIITKCNISVGYRHE